MGDVGTGEPESFRGAKGDDGARRSPTGDEGAGDADQNGTGLAFDAGLEAGFAAPLAGAAALPLETAPGDPMGATRPAESLGGVMFATAPVSPGRGF